MKSGGRTRGREAERGPLEHGCESARSVSEMMSEGTHAVGKRYVRSAGFHKGARPHPLAVEALEVR